MGEPGEAGGHVLHRHHRQASRWVRDVADDTVRVTSGAMESSNVNAVSAMVDMIDLARQFDMQMKALSTVDQNEQHATQLLASGN